MKATRPLLAPLALAFASAFSSHCATPRIDLLRTTNSISLQWPSWAVYFQPWSTTNLIPSPFWSPVTNPIIITNAQCALTVGNSNGTRFYRLLESQPSLESGLIAHYTFDEQCSN